MTVATRHVSSQLDGLRAGPLLGRGPVRKTTVLRSCSPMLVCTCVLYVRRERAESAAMARAPALMDKVRHSPVVGCRRFRSPGSPVNLLCVFLCPLTQPERPSLWSVFPRRVLKASSSYFIPSRKGVPLASQGGADWVRPGPQARAGIGQALVGRRSDHEDGC